MSYFRSHLDQIAGYQPGEQPKTGDFVKLNTNENPYPPPPQVAEAIEKAAAELRLYPDPMADAFRTAAAKLNGVSPENILVGNGSDDLLTMVIRSFVGEGDVIASPYPTYVLYETLARIQDAEIRYVDYPDDFRLPEELAAVEAQVTFVSSPNSPSGTVVPPEELAALAGKLRGVLVVDEAYVDFADHDCLSAVRELSNVLVLRSLSKSYSLAGLRVGYAIGPKELIAGMTKVKDSYNVGRLSMAGAVAALADGDWMRENARKVRAERERLTAELQKLGLFVWPSQANFVLARGSRPPAREVYEELKRRRILVRYFPLRRLKDCLRITVGTPEQNQLLLAALTDILNRS